MIPVADTLIKLNNWSISEAVKIGTFGNKTVYRRTYQLPSGSADANIVIASNAIQDSYIVLDISGWAQQTDGSKIKLGGYYDSTSYSSVWIGVGKQLFCKCKQAISGGYASIIYAV